MSTVPQNGTWLQEKLTSPAKRRKGLEQTVRGL